METVLSDEDIRVFGHGNQCITIVSINSLHIDETMINVFIKSFKSKAGSQINYADNNFTIRGVFNATSLNRILSDVYRELNIVAS